MDTIKISQINNKEVWEDFVLKNDPKSFLQSWNWGETQKRVGKNIYRLGLFKNSNLVATALVIEERAKRGRHFIIPGGPIIDWTDSRLVDALLIYLKNLAKERNAWFIRVRPEIYNSQENKVLLKSYGFLSSPMHLHAENTWILNINGNEQELLYGMRKNTRYAVRKSLDEKLNLKITKDKKFVESLYRLQKQTVKRHKFVGFSKKLFEAQLATFGMDNQAALFLVSKGKKLMNVAIIIFYGNTAYYHHSASSEESRKSFSSYFLQWNVINYAKKMGLKYYNFWGVAPSKNPKHRFAGVTLFKTGFGGEQVDWLHAHDLPLSKLYWMTYIFEILRKKIRRL